MLNLDKAFDLFDEVYELLENNSCIVAVSNRRNQTDRFKRT